MNHHVAFTEQQKTQLLSILPLGCDRATACKYVAATLAQLQAEMKRDRGFAQAVARAEAEVDLRHLGNVYKASRDEKNWRTSVWWLERRSRERAADSDAPVSELVDELARAITAEIHEEDLQRRVIERLLQLLANRENLADSPLPLDQPVLSRSPDNPDADLPAAP